MTIRLEMWSQIMHQEYRDELLLEVQSPDGLDDLRMSQVVQSIS